MKTAASDIVIDMKPNSEGIFEKGCVRKTKVKAATGDVQPEVHKKNRSAKKATTRGHLSRGRKKSPVGSAVPDPVSELQEGLQAGLDFISGVNSIARLFK